MYFMEYKKYGDNLELVAIQFSPTEKIYGEAGAMVYMSGNVQMNAKARGGFMKSLKRSITGESFFVTDFTVTGGTGIVAFAGNAPGRIKPFEITAGQEYFCQKDSFLCAEEGVDLDMAFQKKLSGGLFGGEGFIIQRLSGNGTAFIHATGDIIERTLKEGEKLKVSTGKAVAWEGSVDYSIERTGNVRSMLFSGEGLFVTTLKGPGKVWLQSMTLPQLAASLAPYLPSRDSSGSQKGLLGNLDIG